MRGKHGSHQIGAANYSVALEMTALVRYLSLKNKGIYGFFVAGMVLAQGCLIHM